LTLVVALTMGVVAPQSAYAQLGIGNIASLFNQVNSVANSILTFINNTMRPVLQGVQSAAQLLQGFLGQLRSLWEDVVWPISEINRAKGLAQQLIATFRGLLSGLYRVDVRSAQLPNPAALESVTRNRQVGDQAALVSEFQKTFGSVPGATEVHAEDRNLIDVDDALAVGQLMTLKLADASADRTIQAAEAIENEATQLAPGSAAMASAAAYIAALQSQAHIQKMLAGQLRLEAARLAHETMLIKRGAGFTRESRTKTTELNR
jgi:hypothetical protein